MFAPLKIVGGKGVCYILLCIRDWWFIWYGSNASMMHVLCMYCLCVCFSWCICDVLSYFCLIIYQYHISFQITSYLLKFEDWTSSKVPEKSLGFPSWMSTISRIATGTAFCTNLGGPRMSTDMALLGGFLENRSFFTMFSMSNENFNFTKRCWMPTPTGFPWHHGTVLRRLRIHTLLQEIVHCSIGPESFGGFGFILLFWEKIYKSENSHAALPSVSNPRAFFSQRNPERFGRHALFGQQLESLKVSKSAPPSGCY